MWVQLFLLPVSVNFLVLYELEECGISAWEMLCLTCSDHMLPDVLVALRTIFYYFGVVAFVSIGSQEYEQLSW